MGRGGSGSNACSAQSKAFRDCLIDYCDDISKCQFYRDKIIECAENSLSAYVHKTTVVDPHPVAASNSDACSAQSKAFQHCLVDYGDDVISNYNISECQFYRDRLGECAASAHVDETTIDPHPYPNPLAPPKSATSMGGRHSESCNEQTKAFMHCLIDYGDDISKCQSYMDRIVECAENLSSDPSLDSY